MGRRPRLNIPKETLVELYEIQGLTIDAIARQLGVSYYGIWKAMERHGIRRRMKKGKLAHLDTKEKLERELLKVYQAKQGPRTVAALADKLGVHRHSLTALMKRLGVNPWEVRKRAM